MRTRIHTPLRTVAAATLLLSAVCAQAQDKPVEMKFAHWLPAMHPLAKLGFEPWAKSVEAASKGSIKVMMFPAQQLGKAADHYDMARDGIAEMTWVNPGYQAGRFPLIAAGELPFLFGKPGPGSAALDAWYRPYAATEMKDVKLCFAHVHVGTFHAKKPISEPGQLKGMKIRSANGTVAQTMSLLGATNVQVSAPESRDALEKGLADAITFPWNSILSFGIDKAVKYHSDMRLYTSSFVWVMNKPWYDKLATGQKQVIDDHCNNDWAGKVGAAWGDDEDAGQGKLEKMAGHTIVPISPAQLGV
jgi:TRAP-type C4-dicarboxylate transport system substrate-binding protein